MAPTLRAHGIPIPNRLGKCLARAVAGSLDIVPWHALHVSAMQEFLSTIDRQGTVTLLHNRTRSRLRFAADISRSVDDRNFKLQRDGYVSATADPRVIRAMPSGPTGRIALCFFEWASANEQNVIVDWVTISGENDARDVAQSIARAPRAFAGRTSISAAIDCGLEQLARSSHQASRHVINISGDGTNNSGREETRARDEAVAKGVTRSDHLERNSAADQSLAYQSTRGPHRLL